MKFVAVVETANEAWRARRLVVGVAVSIADATPVSEAKVRVEPHTLFPTRAVTALRTVGIHMTSRALAYFTDFLVRTKISFGAISVRKASLTTVGCACEACT